MSAYPQGEGCENHPGPLLHFMDRMDKYGIDGSCWHCDIRWVHVGSTAWEEWMEKQCDGEQIRLALVAA